ncbi:MAG TPA: hypothetical protein DEO26_04080 [Candidatus Veblenbacteria bacterium]|nr:hypothetical protein [Candidatus Veblenbacteria bacterium]
MTKYGNKAKVKANKINNKRNNKMQIKIETQNLLWEPFTIPANLKSFAELTEVYKKLAPKRENDILTDLEHTILNTVGCEYVEWRPLTEGPIPWALGPKFKTQDEKGKGKNIIRILLPFLKNNGDTQELERSIVVYTLGAVTENDINQVFINLTTTFQYARSPIPENEF